jgi:DNA-binding CsgD family transcriptional regulator
MLTGWSTTRSTPCKSPSRCWPPRPPGSNTPARPLVAHAREELTACGARPRRPTTTGWDALTPSERRIAQLARDGLSNREIAQTLFVTTKTVETHLGAAYRKLGVVRRTELAAALP